MTHVMILVASVAILVLFYGAAALFGGQFPPVSLLFDWKALVYIIVANHVCIWFAFPYWKIAGAKWRWFFNKRVFSDDRDLLVSVARYMYSIQLPIAVVGIAGTMMAYWITFNLLEADASDHLINSGFLLAAYAAILALIVKTMTALLEKVEVQDSGGDTGAKPADSPALHDDEA